MTPRIGPVQGAMNKIIGIVAETIDIGPELSGTLRFFVLSIVGLLTLGVQLYFGNKSRAAAAGAAESAESATAAAQAAVKQLSANGGSTAFDKLTAQNVEILEAVDGLAGRVAALEQTGQTVPAAPTLPPRTDAGL